jgi:hypothetical protein
MTSASTNPLKMLAEPAAMPAARFAGARYSCASLVRALSTKG